jgi:hypothetical protein
LRFDGKCGLIEPMHLTHHREFRQLPALRVDALSTPEQFVLGVCRCWDAFMAADDPTLAWRELAPAFAYMDVLGALCAFDCTFKVLRSERRRPLRFQDTDCSAVGLDEARLLSALANLQHGLPRAAAVLMRGSLTPLALRNVLPPLARIAAALDSKGHRLPLWSDLPADAPGHPPYFKLEPSRARAETFSAPPHPSR